MLLLIILYLLLPSAQVYFYLTVQFAIETIDIVNYICSITALHWIVANVLISAKIPWMQKHLPYDRRIRIHILFSIGIVILILFHAVYNIALGYVIDSVAMLLSASLIILFLMAILWIPVPFFSTFRKIGLTKLKFKLISSYDSQKFLHKILLPIIGILLITHITIADFFYDLNIVSVYLYYILFGVSYGLYFLSLSGIFRKWGTVDRIEQADDIIVLHIKPDKRIQYKGGQFSFLGNKLPGINIKEHPFSFLSSPGQSNTLDFAIKLVGDFTESLGKLKIGDRIWIKGAFGNFVPSDNSPLCLIGSGIGIVPLLSILGELYNKGDNRNIQLFIAVQTRKEIPEIEKLLEINEHMENLRLDLLIFEEDGILYSDNYFKSTIDNPAQYKYYICSSSGVRKIVVSGLKSLGVSKRGIKYDSFSFDI